MSPRRPKKKPELRIFFDTSVIFTGSASDVLRQEVATFVRENTSHADLAVHCYLPEIVVSERQFQMQRIALGLIPSIEKLEKLLGHKLAITAGLLEGRIKEVTGEQIKHLGLKIQSLDSTRVDWKRLMDDAAFRRPPFEPGDREKGFRDSIVIETFMQLVDESPKTRTVCRVVLVAGDKLLSQAAQTRTAQQPNVRVMASLEEVKGLINTLIAEVDEQFVARIQPKAFTHFFEKDNKESFFYKEHLIQKIKDKFSTELSALPAGATRREGGTWFISHPRFIKKDSQRIYWATRINIEAKAFRLESRPPALTAPDLSPYFLSSPLSFPGGQQGLNLSSLTRPSLATGSLLAGSVSPTTTDPSSLSVYGTGSDLPPPTEHLVANGKTEVEVVWSTLVSTTLRFRNSRIESIKLIQAVWDT